MALSGHFPHVTFTALSCHFHGKSKHGQRGKYQESTMNLPWKCHETVWGAMFGVEMKITRKWHESAMKVPWKCHESDMNMTWQWYSGVGQFFIADSWHFPLKNSKIVEIHHIIFISDSCRFHATFMALSWYFQPIRAPNSFMQFSWHFSWKLFQDCRNWLYHVCVCLSVVSVSFLLLIFFHWWFLRLINVFLFFFDQNIGL